MIPFSLGCALYCRKYKYKRLKNRYRYFKIMRSEFLLGTAAVLDSLLEKRISFCSSFKALSTDASFIKIGVCYQKLSTLELNFHYRLSSHFVQENMKTSEVLGCNTNNQARTTTHVVCARP